MINEIEMTVLPSGLRVITDHVPTVDSVALGIWADVGTRHEDMAHNGVAHMVEHMLFKGTPTRNAPQIAEQVENVGGHMNAYTSREVTAYHIHLLKEDANLALDILSDMIQNSTMPDEEIAREQQVILQEIGMTNDTPDDLVFDQYQETAYPEQALGAPILGRSDVVSAMTRDTMMDYVQRFYTPKRLVISAAGNITHDDFVAQVERSFNDLPSDSDQSNGVAADYRGGEHRTEKDLEQSHLILGFQGLSRVDDDFYAAAVLSTIMGGGMSSRLFQEIREKRGLVYSIFSFHSPFQDDGVFGIYAGTGPDHLPELVPVLCEEILRAPDNITADELKRAKSQIKASMVMGQESMNRRANQQAKHLIHHHEIIDMNKNIARIDRLEIADIARAAQRIFASKPTLAGLGPLKKLDSLDRIKGRLAA
jgi:predicted Zn-dependent peptidase